MKLFRKILALFLAMLLTVVPPPASPITASFAVEAMMQDSQWARCRRDRSRWSCGWLVASGKMDEYYPPHGAPSVLPTAPVAMAEPLQNCWDGSVIPASQTCPPRVFGPFLVFFDLDSDEITPAAVGTLDRAALDYQMTGGVSVILAGHTDGSEEPAIELSERRAINVRAFLAGRGVPDAAITTQAFGDARPLVDVPEGAREPQNRRVEITFEPSPQN